jgi:hypothetical protein
LNLELLNRRQALNLEPPLDLQRLELSNAIERLERLERSGSDCCLVPDAYLAERLERLERREAVELLELFSSDYYLVRRSGASSGGVISNALAVQQVIENEPTRATRATSSSVLKAASADA